MKQLNYFLSVAAIAVSSGNLSAQVNYSDFITSGEVNSYVKVAVRERSVVYPPALREANVKYYHKVIRCIDPRQKMNKSLAWPRQPLSDLLMTALLEGYLVPYKNDSMVTAFSKDDFSKRLSYEEIFSVVGEGMDIDEAVDTAVRIQLDHTCIRKYWVMEDWIFDAQHSVFKPRILAIAPVFAPVYAGITFPEQPLCWIPMDDKLRNFLAGHELFNRYNDAARLSYDDFFQMRLFDSYIIFENNVYDNFIADFEEFKDNGVAALLESDRIRNDLFVFEHDLWQF